MGALRTGAGATGSPLRSLLSLRGTDTCTKRHFHFFLKTVLLFREIQVKTERLSLPVRGRSATALAGGRASRVCAGQLRVGGRGREGPPARTEGRAASCGPAPRPSAGPAPAGGGGCSVLTAPVHVRQLPEPGPPVVQVVIVVVPGPRAGGVQGADGARGGAAALVVEDQQRVVRGRRGVVVGCPQSLGATRGGLGWGPREGEAGPEGEVAGPRLYEGLLGALPLLSTHLADEVTDVPWVGPHRPGRELGLGTHGPLVHPPHPGRLAQHVLHGLWLLQLAEVVVLGRASGSATGHRRGARETTVLFLTWPLGTPPPTPRAVAWLACLITSSLMSNPACPHSTCGACVPRPPSPA